MLLFVVIVGLLFQVSEAIYCYPRGIFGHSFYCSGYCCGDTCCYYTWSIGKTAGAIIGGIIALCAVIAVIIFIVKSCCKKPANRTVTPGQPVNTPVFVMSTVAGSNQGIYPGNQVALPPPYAGGSGSAFPPNPQGDSSQYPPVFQKTAL